jgi:hypothetical protein
MSPLAAAEITPQATETTICGRKAASWTIGPASAKLTIVCELDCSTLAVACLEVKMSATDDLEARVATLEKDMVEVRRRLGDSTSMQEWLRRISGRFKDDPDFDEIVRLGREMREADRPTDAG